MTTYSEEALSALTYREIQAIAKTMGIPANKRKDELIVFILSGPAQDEESTNDTMPEIVIDSDSAKVEAVVPAVTPAKRGKKAASTPAPPTATKLSLRSSARTPAPEPVVIAVTPVVIESAKKEVLQTPVEEVIFDAEAPAEEYYEEEYQYYDNTQEEDVQEPSEETEDVSIINNLVKSFASGIHLNGLPTPQGKKTIFEAETPIVNSTGGGYFVNWGMSFGSPVGKTPKSTSAFQTPCKDENANPQYYGEQDSDNTMPEKIVNSHIHFMSPEVKVGNQVHWRYEDYDLEAQFNVPPVPPCTVRKAQVNTPGTANKLQKSAKKGILSNAAVPNIDPCASPQTRQENLMSFWLSKSTPAGKTLFH